MRIIALFIALVSVVGCGGGQERLAEKARIEGAASAQQQVEATNLNLATRATAMETDLERRRRFIDSVQGTYEGTVMDAHGAESSIRLIVTSNLPRLPESHRTRTIEEISYELNNLYLNVQVVEWSTLTGGIEMAFGCVYGEVRPNIAEGEIHLMSSACTMSYSFFAARLASNTQLPVSSQADAEVSRVLASDVIDGRLTDISAFVGRKQSNLTSHPFPLRVRRIAVQ